MSLVRICLNLLKSVPSVLDGVIVRDELQNALPPFARGLLENHLPLAVCLYAACSCFRAACTSARARPGPPRESASVLAPPRRASPRAPSAARRATPPAPAMQASKPRATYAGGAAVGTRGVRFHGNHPGRTFSEISPMSRGALISRAVSCTDGMPMPPMSRGTPMSIGGAGGASTGWPSAPTLRNPASGASPRGPRGSALPGALISPRLMPAISPAGGGAAPSMLNVSPASAIGAGASAAAIGGVGWEGGSIL